MTQTGTFPYVGSKARMSSWIIRQMPKHEVYVEVFGGSGAVLLNKPRSDVEIYNDLDSEIVQFLETMRDRTDEVIEWVRNTPHSREIHEKYCEQIDKGFEYDDPIERAGSFFYLRCTSFNGGYPYSSYNGTTRQKRPQEKNNRAIRLKECARRLLEVQLENLDFEELIDRYDRDVTLFYCDPPYVDVGDQFYSHDGEFDHQRLIQSLADVDGHWIVSYTDPPDGLEDVSEVIKEQDRSVHMTMGDNSTNTERLFMNYDPRDVEAHSSCRIKRGSEVEW